MQDIDTSEEGVRVERIFKVGRINSIDSATADDPPKNIFQNEAGLRQDSMDDVAWFQVFAKVS
jgi:hypothetical protein